MNYHSVPSEEFANFERQLDWFESNFTIVKPDFVSCMFSNESCSPPLRPALLLTFDDGLKSHADVVAPALERRGHSGWFFIPTGLIGVSRHDARRIHNARLGRALEVEGDEILMNWSDVAHISQLHAIGSHTVNHIRLGEDRSNDEIAFEVQASKEELARRLGIVPSSFCWVGGELSSYSAAGHLAIRQAGYRYSFMTNSAVVTRRSHPLWIQRSNVESSHSAERVDVVLSGLNDLRYARKRHLIRERLRLKSVGTRFERHG